MADRGFDMHDIPKPLGVELNILLSLVVAYSLTRMRWWRPGESHHFAYTLNVLLSVSRTAIFLTGLFLQALHV